MKRKFALIISLGAAAMFAGGCGKATETTKQPETAVDARNVTITKVTKSSIEDFYEATGTVKAKTTTQVSANIMGRIVSFPVAEGDTVSKGQVLVEIDNRESQAQFQKAQAGMREAQAGLIEIDRSVEAANAAVQTAEANRQLAQVTFDRYKELFERRSATAQEFDEAQSRLKMARSELDRAKAGVQVVLSKKKQLNARIDQARADISSTQVFQGYSRISSPVSGVVVKKFAESGATAGRGVPLLSIEDNSQYRLEAAVEESRSKLIRIGNRVNVRIDAIGEGEFMGTVAEIMPTSDAASRSYTVKIDLAANPLLRTGLYGMARFPVAQKEAITVPLTAIVERGQLTGVYAVGANGIAQFRIVTTGKTSEGNIEVLTGVSEGDDIVTSDVKAINDGTKVR
ncbi:MAG: efflux RND transporter periplasmic adaptor subunit [Chloracidobacterium sp.]|nr:efflux RND transporter periplasmic adaptor subunit [Chloracidobacterium sp.]